MRQRTCHAFTGVVAVFLSASGSWHLSAQSMPAPPARSYGRAEVVSKTGIVATNQVLAS